MPTYVYRCPICGEKRVLQRPMAERDNVPECANAHIPVPMQRVITAPYGIVTDPAGGSAGGKGR
jgi:putative FmdB family regulatory protein